MVLTRFVVKYNQQLESNNRYIFSEPAQLFLFQFL